ncbi:MscS Mechanosensitive ion channel [Hymenobacter roseosalivarius DSM 11622]|uniref:MscS Mechanosensitive ion channel n=1 Tax=Hymenobacter roseosalivarius DSM 11622 TaxID=645990 RepID=A0A1W1W175_9BACT|nr:mechanosensitive ion channel domain-containing protein [Hymenobacter roseosalivarius]SMB99365.1 MscS Mechanosensitive ion channel [Hymenobacter roseosalivarius DSM 11622]
MLDELNQVLLDYWHQFLHLLPKLLIALVVVAIGLTVANHVSALLGRKLRQRSHDALLADFLTNFTRWALLLAGLLLAMQVLGLSGVASGMLGAAGLSAFIVGFALKDIAENFLAGVVLAFNRPFRIHDTVQVRDLMGEVEALNLRTTLIRTFDGKHIFLPNALVLREPLTNYTRDGFIRQDFLISVDLGTELTSDRIEELLLNYVRGHRGVETRDPHTPYSIVEKMSSTSVDLRIFIWAYSEDYRRGTLELKSALLKGSKAMLQAEGFVVSGVN